MKDMGQQVGLGLAPILEQEGPPLAPFMEVPIEVEEEGIMLTKEDGTAAGDMAVYPVGTVAK